MKTLILIISAFTLTSCITPQQSSYDPYAVYQHPGFTQPSQPKTYHVEQSRGYGGYNTGHDVTVTER